MNSKEKTHSWDSTKYYFSTWCITNCVQIVCSSFQNISDILSYLLQSKHSMASGKDEKTPCETPSHPPPPTRIHLYIYIWQALECRHLGCTHFTDEETEGLQKFMLQADKELVARTSRLYIQPKLCCL